MSQEPSLALDFSSILLTLAASLYYFALQPWAILARSLIIIFTLILSKATTREESKPTRTMAAPRRLIESIELKTKRVISIETALSDQTLATCNPQSQSPLYCKLPKELRDYVFELSCTQSPNEDYKYDANSYYYRPGHTARLKTYTSLLQTCRRAWLEANALPMRQAEHAFWLQRGPYDIHPDLSWRANVHNEQNRYYRLLNSLTTFNLKNVSHIHLFMQMFQAELLLDPSRMEEFFLGDLVSRGFMPKLFTITIRSSDWSGWESGRALSLPGNWVQNILDSPYLGGIEEFALELETEKRTADQLNSIVQQITPLEGKPKLVDCTGHDRSRLCKFQSEGQPRTRHWKRSPRINNTDHGIYGGMATLQLQATTLIWKNKPCSMAEPVAKFAYTGIDGRAYALVPPDRTFSLGRNPRMVMHSRAFRERLRSGGWIVGRFPEKEDDMRAEAVRHAVRWQQAERERYEKMVGDIEVSRLLAEWEERGSLLKFVGQAS